MDLTEYFLSQAVVSILQEMPNGPYGKMVEWFYLLSKHAKVWQNGGMVFIASFSHLRSLELT